MGYGQAILNMNSCQLHFICLRHHARCKASSYRKGWPIIRTHLLYKGRNEQEVVHPFDAEAEGEFSLSVSNILVVQQVCLQLVEALASCLHVVVHLQRSNEVSEGNVTWANL